MRNLTLSALVWIAAASFATAEEPLRLDKLTLKSGKEFVAVTVTAKRPDGISIMHEAGTARVKFEDLPEDIAKQLGGFDPEAAKAARAEQDKVEAATLAEIDRGLMKPVAQNDADLYEEIAKEYSLSSRRRWEKTDTGKRFTITPDDPYSLEVTFTDREELYKTATERAERELFSDEKKAAYLATVPAGGIIRIVFEASTLGHAKSSNYVVIILDQEGKEILRDNGDNSVPNHSNSKWWSSSMISIPTEFSKIQVRIVDQVEERHHDFYISKKD